VRSYAHACFVTSDAQVWNVLIRRFIGQLNWHMISSSGITLAATIRDDDQIAASRTGRPEPRLRKNYTGNGCARPHARAAGVCSAAVNKSTSPAGASGAGAERWTDAAGGAGRDGAERPAAGAADFFTLGQILHEGRD